MITCFGFINVVVYCYRVAIAVTGCNAQPVATLNDQVFQIQEVDSKAFIPASRPIMAISEAGRGSLPEKTLPGRGNLVA